MPLGIFVKLRHPGRRVSHDTRFRSTFPQPADGQGFRTSAWYGVAPRPGDAPALLARTWTAALAIAAKEGSRAGLTWIDQPAEPTAEQEPLREITQSYASIEAKALAVAIGLQERGVQPGEAVMVIVPSVLEFAAVFFGLIRLGAVPVLVEPPRAGQPDETTIGDLADAASRSGASFLVLGKALRSKLVKLGQKVPALARVATAESLIESSVTGSATASLPKPGGAKQTFYVQYAHDDGPHGVEHSHSSVLGNVHALGQAARVNRTDRLLSLAPTQRDLGLVGGLLFSVYWCIPLTVLAPAVFVQEPGIWLRLIAERKITLAAAGGAAFELATERGHPAANLDLSSWRLAPCLGEPPEIAMAVRFAERFAAHGFQAKTLWPVYGITGASLVITAPAPEDELLFEVVDPGALARGRLERSDREDAVRLPTVGRALPGHRVLVVDADGDEIEDGHVGHVVVTGPSLMTGYWNEPGPTAHVLQEGWLWTGDLGFVKKGQLTLTGRARNVLTLGGKNHHVVDVEREIEATLGERSKAAVFVVPPDPAAPSADPRVVAIVERGLAGAAAERATQEVREKILTRFGIVLADVVLVSAGTLVRSSAGAVQRARTRELYLAGSLSRPSKGEGGLGAMASGLLRRFIR